jgi:hypothetical protein
MNFGMVFRAFDTAMALRDAARRIKGGPASTAERGLTHSTAASGLANQIETRLTNVVVAALKEAFDRDHARLELERAQLDEQRRRAEEAMRMELRRQAADRELARLRMLAATALIGWVASVLLLVFRLGAVSVASRAVMAAGWLLLLGALASAFQAQRSVGVKVSDGSQTIDAGPSATAALWLLMLGLGVSATSLLF